MARTRTSLNVTIPARLLEDIEILRAEVVDRYGDHMTRSALVSELLRAGIEYCEEYDVFKYKEE